ncbi:MAG: hypothetical protein WBQ94_05055 [Terracidiphilus sp.]
MTRKLITNCILSIAFTGVCIAQGATSSARTDAHYTQAQVKELALNAHSPEQFKALAGYYGQEQAKYARLASEEKTEWERRSNRPIVSTLAKYPRPVDSARNLYEYYMYKASENKALESKYDRMATQGAAVNAE